jgi:hypothetical protein
LIFHSSSTVMSSYVATVPFRSPTNTIPSFGRDSHDSRRSRSAVRSGEGNPRDLCARAVGGRKADRDVVDAGNVPLSSVSVQGFFHSFTKLPQPHKTALNEAP